MVRRTGIAIMSSSETSARDSRLDQFVRRYYAPLVSFFRRRTRQSADVDDLVQQVFLRLSQHPHVDAIKNPDAYIFQTAANALTDHVRRNGVRRRIFADTGTEDTVEWSSDVSPERVMQGSQSLAQLLDALGTLPERTRDVFMLRCFEGLRHAEIARLQGISVRASESHLAKAIACISHFLERDSEEPPR
jgi:RNA polymerase sigma-70 factor (ECF subfamily)